MHISKNSEWFIPMEVDEQAIIDFGFSREDIRKVRLGCRMICAVMVPCSEKQYRDYMREVWREEQRRYREGKCMIVSGTTGKLVRCTESCRTCGKPRSGMTTSLDALRDAFDREPEKTDRQIADGCDTVLTLMLIDEIITQLQTQNAELAEIFTMLLDGKSHQAIADVIGKPKQITTNMITRLRKQLQEKMKRDEIA